MSNSITGILNKMHSKQSVEKGSYGEEAVYAVCEQLYQKQGGILYHSYEYKVDPKLYGNIKSEAGHLRIEKLGSTTEIDVLYVSPYRIFPIEVKSYKAKEITLTDSGIIGCYKTDKSPVHQNEMHCRHLYSAIHSAIPKGSPDYIVPLVVFVDEATINDNRNEKQRSYIFTTILNMFKPMIEKLNTPMDYKINLTSLDNSLKRVLVSKSKYMPPRF